MNTQSLQVTSHDEQSAADAQHRRYDEAIELYASALRSIEPLIADKVSESMSPRFDAVRSVAATIIADLAEARGNPQLDDTWWDHLVHFEVLGKDVPEARAVTKFDPVRNRQANPERTRQHPKSKRLSDLLSETGLYKPEFRSSVRVHGFVLPYELRHLAPAINSSKRMTELEDDWDGEGSPGYDLETWKSAVHLVVESATAFVRTQTVAPQAPLITKGPSGSVDITWRCGTKKILVNVPAKGQGSATYYGHDSANPERESGGRLDPQDTNEWMLTWLMVR